MSKRKIMILEVTAIQTKKARIPLVPNIGLKTRKKFEKIDKDITFTFSKNLQSILYKNPEDST